MSDNNLTIARELRGLTQPELGALVGVSRQQVCNWESGIRSPGGSNIAELAKVLDVDAAWIAGYPAIIPVPDYQTGTVYQMPVIRTIPIDNYGTLYVVLGNTKEAAFNGPMSVIVGGGVTITQREWDSADVLESLEDIEQYGISRSGESRWYAPDGSPCIMMNGLPRVGWWVG